MEKINQSNKKIMFWFLAIINLIVSITDLVLIFLMKYSEKNHWRMMFRREYV